MSNDLGESGRYWHDSRLYWILLVVAMVLAAVAAVVGNFWHPDAETISFEFRKSFVDFLLIVAIGSVIALLVDQVKQQAHYREMQTEHRRAVLTDMVDELDKIYSGLKAIHRDMRLNPGTLCTNELVINKMKALSRLSLRLELLADHARTSPWTEPMDGANVVDLLDELDNYIQGITKEYEYYLSRPGAQTAYMSNSWSIVIPSGGWRCWRWRLRRGSSLREQLSQLHEFASLSEDSGQAGFGYPGNLHRQIDQKLRGLIISGLSSKESHRAKR